LVDALVLEISNFMLWEFKSLHPQSLLKRNRLF